MLSSVYKLSIFVLAIVQKSSAVDWIGLELECTRETSLFETLAEALWHS